MISVSATTRQRGRVLIRSGTFWAGAAITLTWVVFAVFGDFITPHDALRTDPVNKNLAPSGLHWFGTDNLGRDVLSRVLLGARQVLIVAPMAALLATVVGATLGLVAGYYRGWVDEVLGRIFEALLSVPVLITAVLFLAALGPSTAGIVAVVAFGFTPAVARTVRAATLDEINLEYVTSARLRRDNPLYVMFVEVLPNVMGPIIVEFTVRVGFAIFAVLTLAFLGFGYDPSIPDWGAAINNNYQHLPAGVWWPTLFPALAVASLVVGINLVADSVRQAFES